MKLTSNDFKLHLALELHKRGHTLEEFETVLASVHQPEGSAKLACMLTEPIEKQALGAGDFIPTPMSVLRAAAHLAALGTNAAAIGGATAALPAYGAQKTLDKEDAITQEKDLELAKIHAAIDRLKQEHGIVDPAPEEQAPVLPNEIPAQPAA